MEGKNHEDYSVTLTIPFLHSSEDYAVINSKEKQYTNISGASFISTCFNGLNALSGVGLLSIPYALAEGGWLSLILLLVIASLTFYTGLLIQRCMDTDPTITSYPDIGNRAFGKTGEAMVSITMDLELYLVATGYLILEGDNLSNLFPDMEFDVYGYHISAKGGFIVLVALIILPTSWLHNMNILSYISASGVIASMIILGSVFWDGAVDGVGFQERGRVVNWSGIPSAISLYAFCYCAHPVFPTLYTSMRNQRQFSKVLFLCFAFSTITYSLMAVIGYLMYGSNVESQITLNLPTNNISSRVAICTTLITPIAKYALMLKPIVDSIEARFHASYNKRIFSFFIRTILMTSTVIVALSLPFFGHLMSLVGALLSATTSIIIPCLCYLKISRIYKRIGVEVVFVGFVLLSGLIVAVVGTYVSLVDIVSQL
ncbi:putative amino acid transporter, transmembrane domain-containing protein [Helianthus debilis subsp. tardiflorus]